MSTAAEETTTPRWLNGRTVVISMFLLGIMATAFLYTYWTLHLTPFMPLQEALVLEFPGSAPRVDGGQKKIHKQTPMVLRVAMKTETDPFSEVPEDVEEIGRMQARLWGLTEELNPLPGLQELELHAYKLVKEEEIRKRSWRLLVDGSQQWVEIDDQGRDIPVIENQAVIGTPQRGD
ncbi:MAG: hypothetical protein ACO3FE_05695 [Planctomycetaceae bacterium]